MNVKYYLVKYYLVIIYYNSVLALLKKNIAN